jgi:hypothetical protein
MKEGSSSFLKKRTKKLLLSSIRGGRAHRVNQHSKNLLLLFFKKELLSLWPLPGIAGLFRMILTTSLGKNWVSPRLPC